jgi:hypothetical protein
LLPPSCLRSRARRGPLFGSVWLHQTKRYTAVIHGVSVMASHNTRGNNGDASHKTGVNVRSKSLAFYASRYQPPVAIRTSLRNLKIDRNKLNVPLYALQSLPRLLDAALGALREGPAREETGRASEEICD